MPVYVSKFERVLFEARGQNWPDANKISAFRQGLSSTIRARLAQQLSLPRTYDNFVRVVQQLSGRSLPSVGPAPAPASGSSRPAKLYDPNSYSRTPEAMDISGVDIGGIDVLPSSPPCARSSSPELRERRRSQGQCVRCGGSGHWVADCTVLPYKRGRQGRPRAVEIAVVSDSDSEVYGSDAESLTSAEEREFAWMDWRNHL